MSDSEKTYAITLTETQMVDLYFANLGTLEATVSGQMPYATMQHFATRLKHSHACEVIVKALGYTPNPGDPKPRYIINGNRVEFNDIGIHVGCTFVDTKTVLAIADELRKQQGGA